MSIKDQKSYKISFSISYVLGYGIMSLLKVLFDGVVTISKRYKAFIIIHLCLLCGIVFAYIMDFELTFFIFCFFVVALIGGIWNYVIEYPELKLERMFDCIFEEINLKAVDGSVPFYVMTIEYEYSLVYFFGSFIPLAEWNKKREILELYLNKKIIDILQDEENMQMIWLVVEKKSLPKMIEWDDKYLDLTDEPIFSLGISYYGLIFIDLKQYPHFFVAGATGDGKSNILKCLIHQSLCKNYDVILVDFKRAVSFVEFSDVVEIHYEHETTRKLLEQLVEETKQRLDLFREARIDNIDDYRKNISKHLHRKIVFIDELAELLQVRDKELSHSLYDSLETLTRLARTTGIHLIMGMQRVDSTIITGQIKSNVTGRLCGRFVDKEPSRIMLGNDMACKLAGTKGRFLCKDDSIEEVQCFYYKNTENAIYNRNAQEKIPFEEIESEEIPKKDFKQDKKSVNEIPFDFSDID